MDILDEDFDIGYMPSMMANSRSGSMKKLSKRPQSKEKSNSKREDSSLTKPSAKTTSNLGPNAIIQSKGNNNKDQLDDLLDELMTKNDKKEKPKSGTKNIQHSSSVDAFFDDTDQKSNNSRKNQTQSRQKQRNVSSFNLNTNDPNQSKQIRTSINVSNYNQTNNLNIQTPKSVSKNNLNLNIESNVNLNSKSKNSHLDQIINDDFSQVKFGNNRHKSKLTQEQETPIINVGSSMRSMKPPLRKKDKQDHSVGKNLSNTNNFGNFNNSGTGTFGVENKHEKGIGLSLNVDSPKNKNININQSQGINLNRKRSSIEQHPNNLVTLRSGLILDDPIDDDFGLSGDKNRNNKSRSILQKNQATLTINNGISYLNSNLNQDSSPIYQRHDSKSKLPSNQQNKLIKPPIINKHQDHNTFNADLSTTIINNKSVNNDYQKEIEIMKATHQKQLSSLRQALDQQLSINKITREKLMKQTDAAIDLQRKKNKKITDQQISRMKQIFDWQKKRLQQSYKNQNQSLKNTIQYMRKQETQGANLQVLSLKAQDRKQIAYLQEQLRSQRKGLDDRQKILTKRQYQLQERQQQFNKLRRKQQQRLREEQKRILQQQSQMKKNIYDMKQNISTQKQDIAMQVAQIQLQAIKKKQKLELQAKQLQIQRKRIYVQKEQLMKLNKQLMDKFKGKMSEVAHQQQKVNMMQTDLIQKLRVIEMKAKQVHIAQKTMLLNTHHNNNHNKTMYQKDKNKTYYNAKQNNWVSSHNLQLQNDGNNNYRGYSTGKDINNHHQKMNQTKDRFHKIQKASKTLFNNVNCRSNEKFDLQQYYMSMAKYTRNRQYA